VAERLQFLGRARAAGPPTETEAAEEPAAAAGDADEVPF